MYFFAFQNPGVISKGSLSNHFDVNVRQITKILDILEKTQLIFHIEAFTSSSKRIDLGNANLEDKNAYIAKLLENFVASSFINLDNRNVMPYKIYYDDSKKKKKEKNVDFIVQRNLEKPIPIEVSCGKKDKSQIKRAISKYESSHGVIISNTTQNIVKEDDIIYLPLEFLAFL